jgi:hypothetical protein
MLLIPVSLSITKFLPEHRVDQDGMIQSHNRSSTKNSQKKTMHRSGRSAVLKFRIHFGGHSVMVALMAILGLQDRSEGRVCPFQPRKNCLEFPFRKSCLVFVFHSKARSLCQTLQSEALSI